MAFRGLWAKRYSSRLSGTSFGSRRVLAREGRALPMALGFMGLVVFAA